MTKRTFRRTLASGIALLLGSYVLSFYFWGKRVFTSSHSMRAEDSLGTFYYPIAFIDRKMETRRDLSKHHGKWTVYYFDDVAEDGGQERIGTVEISPGATCTFSLDFQGHQFEGSARLFDEYGRRGLSCSTGIATGNLAIEIQSFKHMFGEQPRFDSRDCISVNLYCYSATGDLLAAPICYAERFGSSAQTALPNKTQK